MLSRNMYKVTRFAWVTRDLQILYRDIRISEKYSSDCIATVAEHDQIHMFRDFVSKCVLGLTVTEVRGFNVNLILVSNMKTECLHCKIRFFVFLLNGNRDLSFRHKNELSKPKYYVRWGQWFE
jgi:hypothetical protein